MGAMQRHGGAFAVFAVLVVTAFNAYQHPARRFELGDDLFAIHAECISKKICFDEMGLFKITCKNAKKRSLKNYFQVFAKGFYYTVIKTSIF
jgi:hypothetical protein